MINLSPRLKTIGELVHLEGIICDVGTDHALLPCYLRQMGAKEVIASDINDGPLAQAKATMNEYGIDGITLIKSDGLKNIGRCDDIIVAGMGGELIYDIISNYGFTDKNTRFILQPMTKAEVLRTLLGKGGYAVISEKAVIEGEKCYIIIETKYTGEPYDVSLKEAFIGTSGNNVYISKQISRLRKMGIGNPIYAQTAEEIENDG